MPADFGNRCERMFRELHKQKLPNLLVTSPYNVTYLSGFTGDDSYLFAADGKVTILSDARYEEQLREECPDVPLFIRKPTVSMIAATAAWLKSKRVQSLCIESNAITLAQADVLKGKLTNTAFAHAQNLIERLRERKDTYEIEAIERAISIAERAFVSCTSMLTGEATEKSIADEIEYAIRKLGGTGSAFKTIVGVGPRAALPHGRPSLKRVDESTTVLIDWGAKEKLYLSDLTRVVITGKPSSKFRKIYETVLQAQQAAIRAIQPGARMSDIDAIARSVIEQAGFGKRFTHSLGHSFGLEIHESIRLAKGQDRVLEPDMVVTVEPGIYIPGQTGVRIEDDVLVTRSSHRVLTSLPKQWDHICNY